MSFQKLDYLILGGGLSGLYCAKRLLKERGIKNLMILEAKNKIGGRIQTYKGLLNNNYADLGAQWILPQHTRVQDLSKNYKLKLFPTYSQGQSIYQFNGKNLKDEISDKSAQDLFDKTDEFVEQFLSFLNQKQITSIPNMTLQDYLDDFIVSNVNTQDKDILNLFKQHLASNLESVTAYPLSKISLKYAQFMEKQGKDFTSLQGEFDQLRMEGGVENLIEKLAQDFEANKYLQLNQKAVEIIQHSNDVVEVKVLESTEKDSKYSQNEILIQKSYFTKNLIISVPPFIFKHIDLQLLDSQHQQKIQNLTQSYDVGNVIKTFLLYDTPFWRNQNLNGNAFCYENPFITDIYDMSCSHSQNGILQVFSVGQKATEAQKLSKSEFRTKIIQALVSIFGRESYNYFDYFSHSFIEDPFVLGGYSGLQIGKLEQTGESPVQEFADFNTQKNQNIFFVGTETSQSFNGYMEGALRSVDWLLENSIKN
ncbi:flavin containing amine oxidase (macronuclear) [Tetrahymena thermophila SB210]|uniref:Amine oxidase n=1 Tax=Tetrahymena thermophila (strain SB210) TaxID=312017 RepID=I7MMK7_TETTS|nr:flavin containing amine oxidase [Tetrahymena thermophila SB210]EAS05048.1 flavin containing amine oxidase [Tetrahymena thermophila SB210]|eukprot:XP_001025293.1 flavin containing amine oxidase [Tetrahymena thermophila SB210]